MSEKSPNVYQRLLSVIAAAGAAPKSGKAAAAVGGYAFHKVDDIVDRLRPLLVEHGVLAIPQVLESETREVETSRYRDGKEIKAIERQTTCQIQVVFVNVDSPEDRTPPISAFGDGIDSSDKAAGKAMSYALKNALLAMFWARGHADNEADSPVSAGRSQGYRKPPPARTPAAAALPPAPSENRPPAQGDRTEAPPAGDRRASPAIWLDNKVKAYINANGDGRFQAAWSLIGDMGQRLKEKNAISKLISAKQAKRMYALTKAGGGSVARMKELVYAACAIDDQDPEVTDHLELVPMDLYQGICTLIEAGGVSAME